jgi:hypothetical protein
MGDCHLLRIHPPLPPPKKKINPFSDFHEPTLGHPTARHLDVSRTTTIQWDIPPFDQGIYSSSWQRKFASMGTNCSDILSNVEINSSMILNYNM